MAKTNLHDAAVAMGRKGGKAGTGAAKARTPEQCRAAVAVRWAKYRAARAKANKGETK